MRRLSVVSLLVVCGAADVPWLDTSAEAPERTPPAPEVYARKDAGWRKQHATTAAHGRPKSLPPSASPLDRLKLEQFRHPTCHSQAHQLGREIFADERKTRASPDAALDAALGAASASTAAPGGASTAPWARTPRPAGRRRTSRALRPAGDDSDRGRGRVRPRRRPRPRAAAERGGRAAGVRRGPGLLRRALLRRGRGHGDRVDVLRAQADVQGQVRTRPAEDARGLLLLRAAVEGLGRAQPHRRRRGDRERCMYVEEDVQGRARLRRGDGVPQNKMHTDVGAQGARFCATLGDATGACIDGLMFRTATFGQARAADAPARRCAATRRRCAATSRRRGCTRCGRGRWSGRTMHTDVRAVSSARRWATYWPGRPLMRREEEGCARRGVALAGRGPFVGDREREEIVTYVIASDL